MQAERKVAAAAVLGAAVEGARARAAAYPGLGSLGGTPAGAGAEVDAAVLLFGMCNYRLDWPKQEERLELG